MEGLGHDTDGQDPQFTSRACHNRSRARSGAAAHARGDEDHMRTGQLVADLVNHFFGSGAPDFRLRTRTQTLGDLNPHLDDPMGLGGGQRLRIGITDNEFASLQTKLDHIIDRITARAANTENGDPWLQFADIRNLEIDCHLLASHLGCRQAPIAVNFL